PAPPSSRGTQSNPLTAHGSQLTAHSSQLTAHGSRPLTATLSTNLRGASREGHLFFVLFEFGIELPKTEELTFIRKPHSETASPSSTTEITCCKFRSVRNNSLACTSMRCDSLT